MAFFKAKVLRQRKDGMYVVYIRVTQNRESKYIRTSWVVGDDGLSRDKHDIIDPFVAEQTTKIISRFYNTLNRIDTKNWTFHASLYSFRHSWATIAQNGCGASLGDIDFALNHSTYKMARVYTKIDYSPAWDLNEKVIDFIFFSNEDIANREDSGNTFERMSKYNLIRGEAFICGECVSVIEDSGFTNVEQVISMLLSSLSGEIERPIKVQIRITNLDKKQVQLYQRVLKYLMLLIIVTISQ